MDTKNNGNATKTNMNAIAVIDERDHLIEQHRYAASTLGSWHPETLELDAQIRLLG